MEDDNAMESTEASPERPSEEGNKGTVERERVWEGELHILEDQDESFVRCVALRYRIPMLSQDMDTAAWPPTLRCDQSLMHEFASVFSRVMDRCSQWFVRFVPVDKAGKEIEAPELMQLIKTIEEKQLVFEIACDGREESKGSLFVWGINMPTVGFTLVGVFRPLIPTESAVDVCSASPCTPGRELETASSSPLEPKLEKVLSTVEHGKGEVWDGALRVRIPQMVMDVPCIALEVPVDGMASRIDSSKWSRKLLCDSSKLRYYARLFPALERAKASSYVRFSAAAGLDGKTRPLELERLAKALQTTQLAFEVDCDQPFGGGREVMHVWGMQHDSLGYSLFGSYGEAPPEGSADVALADVEQLYNRLGKEVIIDEGASSQRKDL